ncbi:hypothetical protein [Streptomyces marincola]|uniref:DUF1449 family protein n=1 Tax=Streptomyces marincola TaxID=2878388 RepID=A0A1W7D0P5_9ACTN|nr:hypothetical protein [Streptomyces marincola]ARQ70527.1 hypothetical protein CAG99_18255 [Streptomyces marincola]
MGDFLETAGRFPAVVFSVPLAVVLLYWIFSVAFGVGASVADGVDGGDDGGEGTTALARLGLGGVPPAIPLSLLTAFAWFTAMAGTELLTEDWQRAATLPAALGVGWLGAWLAALPLRRVFAARPGTRHRDFVGRVCVIRTGRVTASFGQAEVAADDGGTAIVQVRAEGPEAGELTAGRRALIFDYEPEGGFFRVAPYDFGDPAAEQNRFTA